jgi:hypothetical protein
MNSRLGNRFELQSGKGTFNGAVAIPSVIPRKKETIRWSADNGTVPYEMRSRSIYNMSRLATRFFKAYSRFDIIWFASARNDCIEKPTGCRTCVVKASYFDIMIEDGRDWKYRFGEIAAVMLSMAPEVEDILAVNDRPAEHIYRIHS